MSADEPEGSREVHADPDPGPRDCERSRDAGTGRSRATNANAWAMACHLCGLLDFGIGWFLLGVLVPLGIWLSQRDVDPFIDEQGKEALNFQLNVLFWSVIATLLVCLFGLGLLLLAALAVAEVVLVILASIAAAEGRSWRYPWILRVVE